MTKTLPACQGTMKDVTAMVPFDCTLDVRGLLPFTETVAADENLGPLITNEVLFSVSVEGVMEKYGAATLIGTDIATVA